MYVGIAALKPVLNATEYTHFLLLFCACTIVSSKVYKPYIPLAKNLFDAYVHGYITLYGDHSISSNVHNLIHITEELIENNVESMDELSTYKYENCLRLLAMKLKCNGRPLEQISRRLIEIYQLNENLLDNTFFDTIPDAHEREFTEYEFEKNCFKKITIRPGLMLSNKKIGDQWFLTDSGDIVEMKHAVKVGDTHKVCGFLLIQKEIFFIEPIESSKLSIFQSNGKLSTELCMYEIGSVKAKMISLPIEKNFVYIPLLHTLKNEVS